MPNTQHNAALHFSNDRASCEQAITKPAVRVLLNESAAVLQKDRMPASIGDSSSASRSEQKSDDFASQKPIATPQDGVEPADEEGIHSNLADSKAPSTEGAPFDSCPGSVDDAEQSRPAGVDPPRPFPSVSEPPSLPDTYSFWGEHSPRMAPLTSGIPLPEQPFLLSSGDNDDEDAKILYESNSPITNTADAVERRIPISTASVMMLADVAAPRLIELLKGIQLTRDFLRTVQQQPHPEVNPQNFFVRLNMGSKHFLYVAAQILSISRDEMQVSSSMAGSTSISLWKRCFLACGSVTGARRRQSSAQQSPDDKARLRLEFKLQRCGDLGAHG